MTLADRWKANTLGRSAGENQSDSRGLWVGGTTEAPIADPDRTKPRNKMPVAKPVENEKTDQARAPASAMRTRE